MNMAGGLERRVGEGDAAAHTSDDGANRQTAGGGREAPFELHLVD